LLITTPERTFLDLATSLNLVALVVLGDSLIKAGRTGAATLRDAATACRGRGAKLARRAARYLREGVDSAMETRLRMLLVLAGLPVPEVNYILRHPDGSWWMRFDLCYPSLRLIIEYDGRHHAEDSDQWLHDLKRREALDRTGWRIIVVTRHDFYDTPEEVLRRVQGSSYRAWHARRTPSVQARVGETHHRSLNVLTAVRRNDPSESQRSGVFDACAAKRPSREACRLAD
jgi:very-short-patch-repair endonuclease